MANISAESSRRSDSDFVKIYRRYMAQLASLAVENSGALTVLLFLTRNMDGTNALSCSMQTISDFCHMSRQTVSKHLKYLESEGWIQTFKYGSITLYVINDSVAWTSYGDQHEYCKFNATMVLERSMVEGDVWDMKRHTERVKTVCTQAPQLKSAIVAVDDDMQMLQAEGL